MNLSPSQSQSGSLGFLRHSVSINPIFDEQAGTHAGVVQAMPKRRRRALCQGEVNFHDVNSSYRARKLGLSCSTSKCPPSTTATPTGESGGGKSTIFRLLFHLYNAYGGNLEIGRRDVKGITTNSLRRHTGIAPQEIVSSNEFTMYNFKYANQFATDENVYVGYRAARIHQKPRVSLADTKRMLKKGD